MVIQTLGQKDKGLHLPDWLCGRIPREVTSLWGGTTPTIRLDPQASGFFTTNIVVEKPIIQRFARKSKKSGSLLFSMSASKLLRKSSKHRVKVITKTKKVSSTLNATHPPTRRTSKGHIKPQNHWKRMQTKKSKKKTYICDLYMDLDTTWTRGRSYKHRQNSWSWLDQPLVAVKQYA